MIEQHVLIIAHPIMITEDIGRCFFVTGITDPDSFGVHPVVLLLFPHYTPATGSLSGKL
jgi:hypothetical protein